MSPNLKRVLVVGGIGAGLTAILLAATAGKANAAPNPNPNPNPNPGPQPPKVIGKLDPNAALAACGGNWNFRVPPGEIYNLLTPNDVLPHTTVYAFYKDQLWKWDSGPSKAYWQCDDVDVAKLRQYTGFSGLPAGVGAMYYGDYGNSQFATVQDALNARYACGSGWRATSSPFAGPSNYLGAFPAGGGQTVHVWSGQNQMYAAVLYNGQWTSAFMCDATQQTQQLLLPLRYQFPGPRFSGVRGGGLFQLSPSF